MFPNKITGDDYRESYKRKHHSKFLSTDPEVKKRFGVFKVPELLKNDDKQHFQNLYNFNKEVLEQYKLPEEKKEKELKDTKKKEKEKKLLEKKTKETIDAANKEKEAAAINSDVGFKPSHSPNLINIDGDNSENQNNQDEQMDFMDNYQQQMPYQDQNHAEAEDIHIKNLKEVLLKIFDPNAKKEENKELEEELYVKKKQ